jgi:hypothetical protein
MLLAEEHLVFFIVSDARKIFAYMTTWLCANTAIVADGNLNRHGERLLNPATRRNPRTTEQNSGIDRVFRETL